MLWQWAAIVAAGVTAYGLSQVLPLPSTYALSMSVAVAGMPVAALLAAGSTGISLFAYLRAWARWRRQRGVFDVHQFLPVRSMDLDGLLVRSDGGFVRALEVTPANPLALDEHGCERMTRGYTELLSRVPAGMSVQLVAHATPIPLDELLAACRQETDAATATLDGESAAALRALAACHERSLAEHAATQGAVRVRYLLIGTYLPDVANAAPVGALRVPELPARRHARGAEHAGGAVDRHARHARESLLLIERLRSALVGLDVKASSVDARRLQALIDERAPHGATVDFTDRARLTIAGAGAVIHEQTIHLARRPERTFYGWLLHAMQSATGWTLAVHIHVRDRAAERDRYNRAARRLWGINEGAADQRRRPDRSQQEQQLELEELVDELGTGAQTATDTSIYLTLRSIDPGALQEAVTAAARDLASPVDAKVMRGDAMQLPLWMSTLPIGLDCARLTHPMISRNAADSTPFLSTSSGSPDGIPFAFADPGRTLERLDPYDPTHDNATTLIFAKSGGGKTMTTIGLISAALPRGAQVNVIDRSTGHYAFLASLIPGAAHVAFGEDEAGPVINPWDTPDLTAVPRAKVAFLVRLHTLLIGDHDAGEDAYGLGPLERNLLALAIRHTYQRASVIPRERELRATLLLLAEDERDDESASVYRNLAHRLGEYCEHGTYAHLFDRLTNIPAGDAPLLVLNTRAIPEDVSDAVLFAQLEYVTARVERRHEARLTQTGGGRFDGTSVVVCEELWKLLRRRATAAWVVELVRRARHIGLWFIAITQQRSDLDGEHGKALLDNSTIQLFLRNGRDDVTHVAQALDLAPEEVTQIHHLTTEKRSHAQAYLINGERGRGTVTIRLGALVYWIATSDPVNDVPWRELALRQAREAHRHDPDHHQPAGQARVGFAALQLLADPDWHQAHAAEGSRS